MASPILFIHGAWMTSLCWEKFQAFFEGRGFACSAPEWPLRDGPVESLRAYPPAELAALGLGELTDHYDRIIQALPEPPILIGHSFGGLLVQRLLDRGRGILGVAIDPAPPEGVLALNPTSVRANRAVLRTWRFWRKVLHMSLPSFQYAFVNSLKEADQRAVYERYTVPESGRLFLQAAAPPTHAGSPAARDFRQHHARAAAVDRWR